MRAAVLTARIIRITRLPGMFENECLEPVRLFQNHSLGHFVTGNIQSLQDYLSLCIMHLYEPPSLKLPSETRTMCNPEIPGQCQVPLSPSISTDQHTGACTFRSDKNFLCIVRVEERSTFVRFEQLTLPKRTVEEQAPFNRFDVCHSFDFEYVDRGIRRRPQRNPPPRLQQYAICLYNITSLCVVGCMCKHTSCEIHLPHCSDLVRRLASY